MRTENHFVKAYWPADLSEDLIDGTAGELLRKIVAEVPDRIALVDAVADPAQRRRWTYEALLDIAERAACALLRHFSPGERIAICSPNCAEWVLLQYGLNLAGLVLVPINPAYKMKEIEVIIRAANVAGLFFTQEFRGNKIEDFAESLLRSTCSLRKIFRISELDALIKDVEAVGLPTIASDQLLQIQFTSGTSGVPKGACLHHRGTLNTARFVAARARFPDGGVWLNAMPLYHIAGSLVCELGTLASRGTFLVASHFDPALMLELIETERVNTALFVPTMILAMEEDPSFSTRRHDSMKVILSGASAVPASLVRRTKQQFGCDMTILFGQTECHGVVTQTTLDDGVDDQTETIGRPLPQTELAVIDPATSEIQQTGAEGEICIRGYQVMQGYCLVNDETETAIDAAGWLHTGDIGSMDSRGYVRITGRLKDMIIRGGMNIYPREIEDVLFEHEEVGEVSVIGLDDPKWGEIVAAVIRPQNAAAPPSPDELHAYCRARLAAHKAPATWFFVESFPMTPSGKIQKFVLQRWVSEEKLQPVAWSRTALPAPCNSEPQENLCK